MRSLFIAVFLMMLGTIQSHGTPHIPEIGEKKPAVFLNDTWDAAETFITNIRKWSQATWNLGSGVVLESAAFPTKNDIDGLSRSAMLRTMMQYDPSLLFDLSANQSFEHGIRLHLGSEWKPTWASGLSFQVFYRLHQTKNSTPIGITSTATLDEFEIECAYNKGIAAQDHDAVQVSMIVHL